MGTGVRVGYGKSGVLSEFFRRSFGEFSESNSIVFFIEHDIYLMAVTFVMRRQLHIVAIDNPLIVLFINYM